ncbi:2Fe-2S iron-sulfur cluster binding domain-containing protein [Ginsengibacter hankyongi]|uniref:2Fe-2S iron-sulfur cluster binding domain-containing protein n=1 Tax=Ginsengibacter hankyongi TaxID=2607284 RepID=A0A5J5IKL8_9BACT|nr:2Fe-2S iron-sulfur cluster-binding protein [Ginsengibacter hankyongi]KAA9040933.1 2Fe-2S iron-sulfur cluster binding domain-containing protein [Ginsengibacter hankyongi]
MASKVNITIDGKNFLVEEGKNLMQVAKENGIFIPSLCYFEHIEPPLGTCRVCTCKINGKFGPACTEKVSEGLKVEVNDPELKDTRKALVEMMFAEGNHICPACEKSGNCDLQHMGYELGIASTRFQHLFKDRIIDFQPTRMVMEHNRCIKCLRCVVDVVTDEGKKVFTYQNRGNETYVGVDYEQEAKLTEEQAINAMKICPTGAIIVRGVSIAEPFGNRKFDMQSVQKKYSEEIPKHKESQITKKRIATVSLAGCFGCHMSMLDIDAELLDLIELVSFDKSPLTDFKNFTTRCHLGIIEGGCCNDENIETLRKFRENCDVLVAIGECSIWGGLPTLRNSIPLGECLDEAYLNCLTNEPGNNIVPYDEDLPKILDRVYACNEIVKIDYYIPGCPPDANIIWKSIKNILWGEEYSILYSEFKYD